VEICAGVASDDSSYFSGFWVWQMKRPPRKLATTIIEFCYFVRTAQDLFIIKESKDSLSPFI